MEKRGQVMKTIKVEGMTCKHCVMAVKKALNNIDGVKNVKVDLEKAEAVFEEDQPVDSSEIRSAIEKAGYTVA
jgi:copper chaperone